MDRQVGLWMYQNGGGTEIESQIIQKLNGKGIGAVKDINLANAIANNGKIICNDVAVDELDLFFTYNAGQQTPFQVYMYETVSSLIPTVNNYNAFRLTEDKFKTADRLSRAGITCSDHLLVNRNNIEELKKSLADWNFNAIYKPVDGWGGSGLVKLESERDLDLLLPYFESQSTPEFYVERMIKNDFTDYRVDIVDGQYIACYGRAAKAGEWRTNVSSGGHVIPREPTPEIVDLALRAAKATGLEIAGVDIIYDVEFDRYVVIEVNGIPAFATPDQEKIGLNFNSKKIDAIVNLIERTVYSTTVSNKELASV
ncbi:ATP-grasp domain-containing protein [Vibrio sp.]|nr:ATP-grasp domain-containing protein [Vibrio sp.]